jgi:hypothetical protein
MPYPHAVTARLWEPIQPIARGERYEDPLHDALTNAGVGEVDGGGSQLAPTGEVSFAEVAVYLANLDRALELTRTVLEEAGAPEGSELIFATESGKAPLPIGQRQCLALYLDGVGLPEEVYSNLDFEAVLAELEIAFQLPYPALHDTWMGAEETALYFFGDNAEEMLKRADSTLKRLPVCQNARIVLRHGHSSLPRREVRLPRH